MTDPLKNYVGSSPGKNNARKPPARTKALLVIQKYYCKKTRLEEMVNFN